jgi:hypothetical protein
MHRSWAPTTVAWGVAFLLGCLATSPRAREVVTRSVVQEVAASAAIGAQARRYAALADAGASDALVLELQKIATDAGASALEREWLMDRALHELVRSAPTPAGRSLLESIARRPAEIFVQVDPDHGGQVAPLYDPAATARFVLRQWDRTAAARGAAAALAANQGWPIERYAGGALPLELDPARAGIADAFRTAGAGVLANHRAALAAALERGERVDELAVICADRLRDAELFQLVLGQADEAVALDAVGRVPRVLDAGSALDVLIAGSRRAPIASASLLAIGRIAARSARAREYLFTALDDPTLAPSSAAALASLHEPGVAGELGRQLQARTQDAARRVRVLALQLDGSAAARTQLESFARTKAGSLQLQQKVRTWLAQ